MKPIDLKQERRERRKRRVRKKIQGTALRPRLSVFRSNHNIYVQLIDDETGRTLAAASTLEKEIVGKIGGNSRKNKTAAAVVGEALAAKAVEKGIKKIVFDRNGYPYHGRIHELAEAARKGGLEF
ncbi:MAG TPA: 50S ribosomal protein L18 [Phycisphaerae bacterium]|nr:50S ribosomal protein L18 [Phycisphaerae bacterium]HPS52932.1 50S ribosomal protein L18 [Phycisphaerae bacterium]